MSTILSRAVLFGIGVALLAVAFFCVFGNRIGQNDWFQREARFLRSYRRVWYQNGTNADMQMPRDGVNGLSGNVIVINKEVLFDDQKQFAELGWTNSCLGAGTLIITRSNLFLWREPNGSYSQLKRS